MHDEGGELYQPVIGNLSRARIFLKTTAVVVTIAFLGLYLQPLAIAAKLPKPPTNHPASDRVPSDEEQLAQILERIEQKLDKLEAKLTKFQDASTEEADLKQLHKQLIALDKKAMANFRKIEQHLKEKKLPQVILDRHYEAVSTYKKELQTLLDNLNAVESAKDNSDRIDKTYRTKRRLKAEQRKRRHTPFDPNNLPVEVPDAKTRTPAQSKKEFEALGLVPQELALVVSTELMPGLLVAQAGTTVPPNPADLMPTEDVQITTEIQALAEALDKNPVKIFSWVHNQIYFVPTYGSIQGSQLCLETKHCNAFDTASLFIALLRASNIPARYVYGTVEIPIEKVMNWVGDVKVPEAALQVLGQGGIPNQGVAQAGRVIAVRMEHVWVEAFVDLYPSRGAIQKQGDSWVGLDGSFKQYNYVAAPNIDDRTFDDVRQEAESVLQTVQKNEQESWISGVNQDLFRSMLTFADAKVISVLTDPERSLAAKTIFSPEVSVLSGDLPYRIVARSGSSDKLLDSVRLQFSYNLYRNDADLAGNNPD